MPKIMCMRAGKAKVRPTAPQLFSRMRGQEPFAAILMSLNVPRAARCSSYPRSAPHE